MTALGPVLPEHLVRHARNFYSSGHAPATPRRAATVVLLRDSADGLEAYLIRRAASMAFASGMHAFPGGSVDPWDTSGDIQWAGPSPAHWARRLGLEDDPAARLMVCAAVRETFEESGVLLAGVDERGPVPLEQAAHTGSAEVVWDVSGPEWEAAREALVDRELAFSDFLASRGLSLRSDLLAEWARWITPEFEPRRYDTCFFLAALPSAQQTRDVGGEADGVAWMKPADAVRRQAQGEIKMLPPTLVTLSELASYDSVAAAVTAAGDRDLTAVTPRIAFTDTCAHLTL